MAALPQLRRLLLGLCGPGPDRAGLAALGKAEWARLCALAGQHRVEPLLHVQTKGGALDDCVPPEVRQRWREAHRAAGIAALVHRGELLATVALLEAAGIRPIALKGAWLARHAYPAEALRPMRDIDLLVDPGEALAAWEVLFAAGYAADEGRPDTASLERAKQLPGLVSPRGVQVELHLRPWESAGDGAVPAPAIDVEGFRARAARVSPDDPIAYPAPLDTFEHLVIHSVYSHGLDVGPLLLTDIEFCLAKASPDWPAFWRRAQAQGWDRAAALVIALVDRWRLPGLLGAVECPLSPPASLMAAAPDLLLQDLSHGRSKQVISELHGAWLALPAKLFNRLRGGGEARGRYWQWLGGRLGEAIRQLPDREAWRSGADTARLARWLAS